jgi:hypothetical protein
MMPTFDGVVIEGLRALGVPSVALFLVVTAFAVKSWVDGVRQVNKGVVAVGGGIKSGWGFIRQMPKSRLAGTIIFSFLVSVVQLLLLEFCFILGNFLSVFISAVTGNTSRVTEFSKIFHRPLQPLSILPSGLRLDAVSGAYLLFGLGCLVWSYWLALRQEPTDQAGKTLAFPATLLGLLGVRVIIPVGIITAIGLVLNMGDHTAIPGLFSGLIRLCVILIPGAAVFYAASIGGVRASRLFVDTWLPLPTPAPNGLGGSAYTASTRPSGNPANRPLLDRLGDYLFWQQDFDSI